MGIQHFQQLQGQNDLLQEVIDQLHKDLSIDAEVLRWVDDDINPYKRFVADTENYLRKKLTERKSELMQLLYRVDISENKSSAIWAFDQETRVKMLTEMVLNRELQKVLTRRLYKQK